MNLFIDTNVFLSFYHLTGEELEELRKLSVLLDSEDIILWLTQQVADEYLRNREVKLTDALKKLKEQKVPGHYPAFCKDYEEYEQLRNHLKEYDKCFSKLMEKILNDIENGSLGADDLIGELFEKACYIETNPDNIDRAHSRISIGNPPGKNGSLGDAISWEMLLSEIPQGEDLHLVSDDKDFFSVLNPDEPKEFLVAEWSDAKKSSLHVYRRLSQFFKQHYPDIGFAKDLEVKLEVDSLITSPNFSKTHSAIEKLSEIDEFTEDQVKDLMSSFFSNSQIHWIAGDPDVKDFYSKLIDMYSDSIDNEVLEWSKSKLDLD